LMMLYTRINQIKLPKSLISIGKKLVTSCKSREMSTQYKVKVGDVDFSYNQVGTGDHVVLLLPGALGCSETDFEPQLKTFDTKKFNVISLDLRGYGNTRPPSRQFSVDFYEKDAEDAFSFMQKLGHLKFSILGWSDGGNSAAIMAAKYSNFIKKLVVWGSNSFVTPKELKSYQSIRDINSWSPRMREPMVKMYGYTEFERMWHSWVDIFSKMNMQNDGLIDLYQKDLSKIKCETLIIHGLKDALVPLFQSEHLKANIEKSELLVWDDGAHNLHLRHHKRFKKTVEEFLSK